MKTALMQAIEIIESKGGFYEDNMLWIDKDSLLEAIIDLLPTEQKQIEDAYNQDLYGGLNGNKKFDDGKDYYTQTFTEK